MPYVVEGRSAGFGEKLWRERVCVCVCFLGSQRGMDDATRSSRDESGARACKGGMEANERSAGGPYSVRSSKGCEWWVIARANVVFLVGRVRRLAA